jgi:hypothetical protein
MFVIWRRWLGLKRRRNMVVWLIFGKYQVKPMSIISLGSLDSEIGIQEKHIPDIELGRKLSLSLTFMA